MLQKYLLCYIMFVPLLSAHNKTTFTSNSSTENSAKSENKNTVLSEGGPIFVNTSSPVSSKDNYDTLLGLELANNEHVGSSVSKIHPRKGAPNITDVHRKTPIREDTTIHHAKKTVSSSGNRTETQQNITETSSSSKAPVANQNQSSITPVIKHEEKYTELNLTLRPEKPVPKKPLILSYEKLDKIDVSKPVMPKTAAVTTSSKSTVRDQIFTSKIEPAVTIKSTISKGHPEMVIPVVITMIAVPVFAVLGYMALKRGKEAWRNRHYKRMDYLIDGMYNDQ